MSKILKNNTGSPVSIDDTGVTVPASGQYVIPPEDYLIWAASSDVVTKVGDSTLTVNDGSDDLTISIGIDLIKGLFPRLEIQAPTITNTTIVSANTEETITLGLSTRKFTLAARQRVAQLQLAYNIGESGTIYTTIRRGVRYERSIIRPDTVPIKLYIQSDTNNTIIELEEWT